MIRELPSKLEGHCFHCDVDAEFRHVGGYIRTTDKKEIHFYSCACGETYTYEKLKERQEQKGL